eukprot:m51a1_g79 hypothetical protein (292) ;mRNA; f:249300-257062
MRHRRHAYCGMHGVCTTSRCTCDDMHAGERCDTTWQLPGTTSLVRLRRLLGSANVMLRSSSAALATLTSRRRAVAGADVEPDALGSGVVALHSSQAPQASTTCTWVVRPQSLWALTPSPNASFFLAALYGRATNSARLRILQRGEALVDATPGTLSAGVARAFAVAASDAVTVEFTYTRADDGFVVTFAYAAQSSKSSGASSNAVTESASRSHALSAAAILGLSAAGAMVAVCAAATALCVVRARHNSAFASGGIFKGTDVEMPDKLSQSTCDSWRTPESPTITAPTTAHD